MINKRSLVKSLFSPVFWANPSVGGQAVIEGVMMRAGSKMAIAVRKPDGKIDVDVRPWFSLTNSAFLKRPFVRGFPMLLETLVNGIKALNYSAQQALDEEEGELNNFHLALTMIVAIGAALLLFVAVPHGLSLLMQLLGAGGDVKTLSFHAWDGVFKLGLFLGYIASIAMVPDIKRVFQYHGAEHKTIWTFEKDQPLTPENAIEYSRLHPRCGTAFLLFVLAISIVLFAVLVPLALMIYTPESAVIKHIYIIILKLFLMIPISCLAYELIRMAGKHTKKLWCRAVCLPGILMQYLTTKEPDKKQLEVAIAALKGAVGREA